MPIKFPSFRQRKDAYPPDLWTRCPGCAEMLFNKQLDKAQRVCPSCNHHFRLSAAARIESLFDPGTFAERDAQMQSVDALGFVETAGGVAGLTPVGVSENLLQDAAALLSRHALSAADAVQLSSAMLARDADPGIATFACFDVRLRQAAAIEGFRLVPPTLPGD